MPAVERVRPLAPGDFAFHGFGGLMRRIERKIGEVAIRGGEPGVEVVEGAVFVPPGQPGRDQRHRGRAAGGLLEPVAAAPVAEVAEEVVYLGWLFDHYGHFLMQSLARVWFLAEVDPAVRVVFDHPTAARWPPAGWATRLLAAFGVPPERLLVLEAPARLRRVLVPEPLFVPRAVTADGRVHAHAAMARPHQAVAARIAGDARPSPQPLYLSRRLLPSSQRLIVGEDELEAVLRANGFRIASPERMGFAEQVRLVNEHADIFSNAGSAAHNVLFARHAPRLHLLTNADHFSPDYFMYATLIGAPTSFVNCLSTAGRPTYDGAHKLTPHLAEPQVLVDYLRERGFLAEPPAALAERAPRLRAAYDEAWLYGRVRAAGRREALPAEVEREALDLTATSWPVSLGLARYYALRDDARAGDLAARFAALAAAEPDRERLARYRAEVERMAAAVARRCGPETVARLTEVVAERFRVDPKPADGAS